MCASILRCICCCFAEEQGRKAFCSARGSSNVNVLQNTTLKVYWHKDEVGLNNIVNNLQIMPEFLL